MLYQTYLYNFSPNKTMTSMEGGPVTDTEDNTGSLNISASDVKLQHKLFLVGY